MSKKKIIAALVLLALIIGVVIGSVKLTDFRKEKAGYTEPTSVTETTSLYGDNDPKEKENIKLLSEQNKMIKAVKKQLESFKEDGKSETALTLKKTKMEKRTVYLVLSDNEDTKVYYTFSKTGPTVFCDSKKKSDVELFKLCAGTIVRATTPSVGKIGKCKEVVKEMMDQIKDNGDTVTYFQNYTEYTYKEDGHNRSFSAAEASVVG